MPVLTAQQVATQAARDKDFRAGKPRVVEMEGPCAETPATMAEVARILRTMGYNASVGCSEEDHPVDYHVGPWTLTITRRVA